MANYVSLEEAAKILGVSTDELVEMRSRGEIFGYRDGSSWKFKEEEIDRVQAELQGDALDEDAGGSSILVSDRQLGGSSAGSSGPTIGKDASASELGLDSDLRLMDEDSRVGSDVKLVADPKSGSGVRLVNRQAEDDGDELLLAPEDNASSDIDIGSDLKLQGDPSGIGLGHDSGGIDLGSGSGGLGSELELASDDEDDLVLGSDSGVGLGSESGINLMSPSDSGLSLEDEPLDLAGTGISGLDLGAEIAGGSGPGSAAASGLGSGALVDFEDGEEFQLTPSGGLEADEDSGSQVIELEDSTDFGSLPEGGGFGGEGFDPIQEEGGEFGGFGGGEEDAMMGAAVGGAAGYRPPPETPYATIDIMLFLSILILLSLCGILVSDLSRNLWAWDGQNGISTALTDALVGILPK